MKHSVITLALGLSCLFFSSCNQKDKEIEEIEEITIDLNIPKPEPVIEEPLYDDKFQIHENCVLSPSKFNDGDSFLVEHDREKQEYRLYFVDTPESRDKPYDDHKQRVERQGEDLGGLSYKRTISVGYNAKTFTSKILQKPFNIFTVDELVYGGPRKYAFVQVDYEGEQRWLHEVLIENGLARIHTKGVSTPVKNSAKEQKERLKTLQESAKKAKKGAWQY